MKYFSEGLYPLKSNSLLCITVAVVMGFGWISFRRSCRIQLRMMVQCCIHVVFYGMSMFYFLFELYLPVYLNGVLVFGTYLFMEKNDFCFSFYFDQNASVKKSSVNCFKNQKNGKQK